MNKILIGLSLITLLLLSGCASRKEIETMKNQLSYLERSSGQMQERMTQLDSLFRVTVDKNVQYQADLKTALADLIDRSNKIDGRLTDIEGRLGSAFNRSEPAVRPPTTSQTTNDTSHAGQTTDSVLPQVDPNKLFNNAFTDLKSGNYDLAIMEFNEYISLFKESQLADDAQYWLGECYYGKKEYAKAIPEFEKVEKNYPGGDKLVAALFKMARSYEESGNKQKAKVIFQRIVKDYPDAFEAKPAQDRLKDLQ